MLVLCLFASTLVVEYGCSQMVKETMEFPTGLCVALLSGRIRRSLLAAIVAILLFLLVPCVVWGSPNKTVLILNSYHEGLAWTDQQVSAAQEVLLDTFENIDLYIEYMDTKRHYSPAYLERLAGLYKAKFRDVKLDAIVTTDDNALRFVMNHHGEVFGNAPVSFCGINDYRRSVFAGRHEFTGVIEVLDIKPTIDLALTLHPATKKIVVVVDNTPTGMGQRKDVATVAEQYDRLEFEYLTGEDLTNGTLLERLRHLPRDSIVLLTVWLRDKNNTYIPPKEGGSLISSASAVPVYGIVDMYLGHGIVGGKLLNSRTHGRVAAEIALRLLNGENATDIPVLLESVNPYMFDYQQLGRWGIDSAELPKGSVVINKPFSLYEKYSTLIWTTGSILVILVTTVAFLTGNVLRRKRAEAALRESQQKYERLSENSPAVVFQFMMTPEGKYVFPYISEGALRTTGVSAEEAMADSSKLLNMIYPDDVERFQNGVRESAESLEIYHAVFRHIRDREVRWVECRATPERRSDGSILWDGLFMDVTDRKRAELDLMETKAVLQAAMDNSPAGIAIANAPDGKLRYVNDAALMIRGKPKEAVVSGVGIDEYVESWGILHLDGTPCAKDEVPLARAIMYGEICNEQFIIRKPDDEDRVVWAHAAPIRNSEGKVTSAIVIFPDITEQKRAEDALRHERDLSERVMETSPAGITRVDAEGRLAYANRRAEEILGIRMSEGFGRTYDDPSWKITDFNGGPFPEENLPFHVVRETNEPVFGIRHAIEWPNGKRVFLSVNATPFLDDHGRFEGMVCTIEDITRQIETEAERAKLEVQLRQAQKMESIGTLAGGIAHDFNNILTPILVQAELTKLIIDGNHTAQGNLDEIMKAGQRAKDLVKQILTFSRQSEQQRVSMDLAPLIKESLKLLRSSIPTTIEVTQNIVEGPCTVMADPTQMQQIIMNLSTNASQAMQETGGVLEVGLRRVELKENEAKGYANIGPGRYIMLTVSDTGCGIEPELLEKIFDPFFTTKAKGEGTGMGLSVVDGIVRSHGGVISVYSEIEKGTTFKVLLPQAEEALVVREHAEVLATGTETILFVDDDPSMVKTGQQMLKQLGYQVEATSKPVDALAAFRDQPDKYDLVVTDMTMPDMTGESLAKALMRVRPDIPVIICTGFSHQMDEEKALAMGISAFVMKPFVVKDVAHTIRNVLASDTRSG